MPFPGVCMRPMSRDLSYVARCARVSSVVYERRIERSPTRRVAKRRIRAPRDRARVLGLWARPRPTDTRAIRGRGFVIFARFDRSRLDGSGGLGGVGPTTADDDDATRRGATTADGDARRRARCFDDRSWRVDAPAGRGATTTTRARARRRRGERPRATRSNDRFDAREERGRGARRRAAAIATRARD